MEAKKCDKCKKFYEPYKGLHKWGMSPSGEPLFEIPFNKVILENRNKRENIDLNECSRKIRNLSEEDLLNKEKLIIIKNNI